MVREEGHRTQSSVLVVFRMAGSVLEVRQDAHGRGGLDGIGWGRAEGLGQAVSEGRCSVLPPQWSGGLEAGDRQRSHSSGALRPDDREDGREL